MSEFALSSPERQKPNGQVVFMDPNGWGQALRVWEQVGMLYPDTSPEVKSMYLEDLEPGSVLGYEIDGEMVGVVIAGPRNSGNALIQRLAVFEEHRNKGVATALLDAAEEILRERGVERTEVQLDPDNEELISWYEKRNYGTRPEDRYVATGLMNPIHSSPQESQIDMNENEVKIPHELAIGAFMSIFDRHTYFSTAMHSVDRYGCFCREEYTELEQALSGSSIEGLQGLTLAPDMFREGKRLYTPVTEWQTIDSAEDSDGYALKRRWHAIEDIAHWSKDRSKILRIQDIETDHKYQWGAAAAATNLTADGYYVLKRSFIDAYTTKVVPFMIQDGKVEELDEATTNWMLRALVNGARYFNNILPPDVSTVRPEDLYKGHKVHGKEL